MKQKIDRRSLSRASRTPVGQRLTPQPRDLVWFEKLHRHGPLPTSFLHAFTKHIATSEKRAIERMGYLYHEPLTPHFGPYFERPWQQFATIDARYQQAVYELTPHAIDCLKEEGLYRENTPNPTGSWAHNFMVACITASIELACIEHGFHYIHQDEIVKGKLAYPITFKQDKQPVTKNLIPDAIFGIEYPGPTFRLYALEADRNTEPVDAASMKRKSFARNILQYEQYVGKGLYKDHLGRRAGMLVLNITTNDQHMKNMMAFAGQKPYMLYKSLPTFGRLFKPPRPMLDLLTEPFERYGRQAISLSDY